MPRFLICLVGDSGAGKTTAGELLSSLSFDSFSPSRLLREEATAGNPRATRAEIQQYARTEQQEHGDDIFVSRLLDQSDLLDRDLIVLDGLRNRAERDALARAINPGVLQVWAVVAGEKVRFQRVLDRSRAGDPTSLVDLRADDERAQGETGATFQENGLLIATADQQIVNDAGHDALLVELTRMVDQTLSSIEGAP